MTANRPKLTIISGGQTGADRAALDWAISYGIPHGGWCPRGRRAEDGPIPPAYKLQETESEEYEERTIRNILDSDGTVIISVNPILEGGSLYTLQQCKLLGKPVIHLHQGMSIDEAAKRLVDFVRTNKIHVLNVAGPRASKEPTVGELVRAILDKAFGPEGIEPCTPGHL